MNDKKINSNRANFLLFTTHNTANQPFTPYHSHNAEKRKSLMLSITNILFLYAEVKD